MGATGRNRPPGGAGAGVQWSSECEAGLGSIREPSEVTARARAWARDGDGWPGVRLPSGKIFSAVMGIASEHRRKTTSRMSEPLNSNPEVLLRKRRDAERTRLEKQREAAGRRESAARQKRQRRSRFVRAENVVARTLATSREQERVRRVSKLAVKRARGERARLASDRDHIVKVTEAAAEEGEEPELETEKVVYDGTPTLLFVVRVRGPAAAGIPHKAHRVLSLLRLGATNTGVFVRLTERVFTLLKLVAPYVVVGRPSLSAVRSLVQKRSRVVVGGDEAREIALNDNSVVEEQLGDLGVICLEDIVHEIFTLGDAFQKCAFFLQPFELSREVSGFGALNKLKRITQREDALKTRQFSNAATAPVIEIDIDSLIAKLN